MTASLQPNWDMTTAAEQRDALSRGRRPLFPSNDPPSASAAFITIGFFSRMNAIPPTYALHAQRFAETQRATMQVLMFMHHLAPAFWHERLSNSAKTLHRMCLLPRIADVTRRDISLGGYSGPGCCSSGVAFVVIDYR